MNNECGCCEGTAKIASAARANRPGLTALAYRYGTHATVLEAMLARLSSSELPALRGLTTRASDDPAIALLDAWATVADVLTFYQERLANEGYLRTATERRSVLELARLVGYALRPGVAASTYLAFTLDPDARVTIAAGSSARSVPGPGEQQQVFETAVPVEARGKWNNLQVRTTVPQLFTDPQTGKTIEEIYLKGITANLQVNAPLLVFVGNTPLFYRAVKVSLDTANDRTQLKLLLWEQAVTNNNSLFFLLSDKLLNLQNASNLSVTSPTVKPLNETLDNLQATLTSAATDEVKLNALQETSADLSAKAAGLPANATKIQAWLNESIGEILKAKESVVINSSASLPFISPQKFLSAGELLREPSLPPANAFQLPRNIERLKQESNAALNLIGLFTPQLGNILVPALQNAEVTEKPALKVYALRIKAALFGNNLPGEPQFTRDNAVSEMIKISSYRAPTLDTAWAKLPTLVDKPVDKSITLVLDGEYDRIKPGSWLVIDRPSLNQATKRVRTSHQVTMVESGTMSSFGVSIKSTILTLDSKWLSGNTAELENQVNSEELLRHTVIYAQSEELALVERPIEEPICGTEIELNGWYADLKAGQWLVVSGERTDIPFTSGVSGTELVMLADLKQSTKEIVTGKEAVGPLPGDKLHTFITLAQPLAYCYKRDTVKIYGNVVKATHGETRREVLGSGQASQALQQFTLKQPPLTFVADANPTGVASTLEVFVNDVRWHEADTLAGLQPNDRNFVTKTDEEGKTAIICGNGRQGARLPTGSENIQARYRSGIGKVGNVKAGQLSLLGSPTLGVKEVVNPLAATGGADPESRDQARRNAPLAVMALDRLVSARDYADFARTFAGIAKAYAVELPSNQIHLTIAGLDDMAIAESSDLWRNLRAALRRFGDQQLPFKLALRELKLLVLSANVSLHPDYQWEKVEPQLRAALLERFSFERRELGQDATLSEAVSVMQRIPGVEYVDVDTFGGVPEKDADGNAQTPSGIETIIKELLFEKTDSSPDPTKPKQKPDARVTAELTRLTGKVIRPAQLVYLTPEIEATLILNEVKR